MTTPYNTGKVKIGLAYQRKIEYATDAFLQRALLEDAADRQHITAVAFIMAACFAAAIAMILVYT